MSDTIRSMRMWVGVLLAVTACSSDPSLNVTVTEHDPYKSLVAETVLTVYAGTDVTCDAIENGDITDVDLAALAVSQTVIGVGSGGSISVDRVGDKSLVARGLDAKANLVLAGCADVATIGTNTQIAIDTLPSVVVAVDPGLADEPFTGRPITVTTSDIQGQVLETSVSYVLSGPAGTADSQPATPVTTTMGTVMLTVSDVAVPGPEALRIRIPWMTTPPPLTTAFSLANAQMLTLPAGGTSTLDPSCAVRGHGSNPPTLVCLNKAQPLVNDQRDVIEISWTVDHWVMNTIQNNIAKEFEVFVDHDGSATDEPVYVVASDGKWYAVPNAAGTVIATFPVIPLKRVVYIPSCNTGEQAFVAVEGATVDFYLPNGTYIPSASSVTDILGGGCISIVNGGVLRAVAAVTTNNSDFALYPVSMGGGSSGVTPIGSSKFSGAGFITMDGEQQFAATRFDATGTVVVQDVLTGSAGNYDLLERREVEAASAPIRIAAGQLDNDTDPDLIWNMPNGLRNLFQVSLAKTVDGAPLTAITSGGATLRMVDTTDTDFVVANLNGKGGDEVVLFSAGNVVIVSPDP